MLNRANKPILCATSTTLSMESLPQQEVRIWLRNYRWTKPRIEYHWHPVGIRITGLVMAFCWTLDLNCCVGNLCRVQPTFRLEVPTTMLSSVRARSSYELRVVM